MKWGYRVLFKDGARIRARHFDSGTDQENEEQARAFALRQRKLLTDYRIERYRPVTNLENLLGAQFQWIGLDFPFIWLVGGVLVCYAVYELVWRT